MPRVTHLHTRLDRTTCVHSESPRPAILARLIHTRASTTEERRYTSYSDKPGRVASNRPHLTERQQNLEFEMDQPPIDCTLPVPAPSDSRPDRKLYQHPDATQVAYSCDTCERTFSAPHHLTLHLRSCGSAKRKVDRILHESKEFWEMRKRRRVEREPPEHRVNSSARAAPRRLPTSRTTTAVQANTPHTSNHAPVSSRLLLY